MFNSFFDGDTHKLNDIWTSGTLRIMDIECNEMEYGLYDELIELFNGRAIPVLDNAND